MTSITQTTAADEVPGSLDWLIPIITPRLSLRRLHPKDLHAFMGYRSDPRVALYQGWTALSEADSMSFLEEVCRAPFLVEGQWFQLGIADRHTNTLIGDLGLFRQARPESGMELGFTLCREAQGKGLAMEAVSALIAVLFEHTSLTHIDGITDARNHASIRLLERLGMTRLKSEETIFRDEPCVEHHYRLFRK